MKSIYLLLMVTLIYSCSPNRIEIGHITTRAQLDSIIALLPADSVRIDSLTNRRLTIKLRGYFSIFNQPIQAVDFKLAEEELTNMYPVGSNLKYVSMLNSIEAMHGLGKYDGSRFSWILDNTTISFEKNSSAAWESWGKTGDVRLNELHDSIRAEISFEYDGLVKNKITDLAGNATKDSGYIYSLAVVEPYGVSYELYVNEIAVPDPDTYEGSYFHPTDQQKHSYINHILSAEGLQTITAKVLANRNDIYRTLSKITMVVGEINKATGEQRDVAKFEIAIGNSYIGKKQDFQFNLPKLPHMMDYADGIDMRTVSNIKEQMYAHYQALQKAYEEDKTDVVLDMLYPVAKANATAYNRSYADLSLYCIQRMYVAKENEGLLLLDIADMNVEFAANGKLARLVSKKNIDEKLAPLTAYIADTQNKDYMDFYFYMDKNNKLNFAIE